MAFISWDATLSNIVVEDSTVTNALRFAVCYEVGGSVTLRRVVSLPVHRAAGRPAGGRQARSIRGDRGPSWAGAVLGSPCRT